MIWLCFYLVRSIDMGLLSSATVAATVAASVIVRGVYVVAKGTLLYQLLYLVLQGHTLLYSMDKIFALSASSSKLTLQTFNDMQCGYFGCQLDSLKDFS